MSDSRVIPGERAEQEPPDAGAAALVAWLERRTAVRRGVTVWSGQGPTDPGPWPRIRPSPDLLADRDRDLD